MFKLADYVKVANASLENGLLAIDLAREIPEEMKPRRIAITSSVSAASGQAHRRRRTDQPGYQAAAQSGLISTRTLNTAVRLPAHAGRHRLRRTEMTDFHSLLDTPARTLRFEVLDHPSMGVAEKRALLASWASDANVVPGAPSLRQLNDGSLVAIDEILRALKSLDMGDMRIPERGGADGPHGP